MKQAHYILAVLLLAILCYVACREVATADLTSRTSDTVYTAYDSILNYGQNPLGALATIDSTELVGDMPPFMADLLRAKVFAQAPRGYQQPDTAIAICNVLLRHDSLQATSQRGANMRMELLRVLCSALSAKGDFEGWLQRNTELAVLYREWGDEDEALSTEAEIGFVLTRLGRTGQSLADLEAGYDVQEEEIEEEMDAIQARHYRQLAFSLGCCALLALAFAIYFQQQKQIISRKNKALTKQVTEAIAYKEKYINAQLERNIIAKQQQLAATPAAATDNAANNWQQPPPLTSANAQQSEPGQAHATAHTCHSGHPANPCSAMDDKELFAHIRAIVYAERLYLNPSFGRQTLQTRFHLSKERVGQVFALGSNHSSLPDFVNECRLEHAFHLLLDQPQMSISEVATASGFTNPTTFGRRFREKYAMTPSEHRQRH